MLWHVFLLINYRSVQIRARNLRDDVVAAFGRPSLTYGLERNINLGREFLAASFSSVCSIFTPRLRPEPSRFPQPFAMSG
jgi:hypothetical protein